MIFFTLYCLLLSFFTNFDKLFHKVMKIFEINYYIKLWEFLILIKELSVVNYKNC